MAVAVGDQRRRKEAMEALIEDITKGSEQAMFPSIRSALEVRLFLATVLVVHLRVREVGHSVLLMLYQKQSRKRRQKLIKFAPGIMVFS